MTAITCKMCGRSMVVQPGSTVASCESCGSLQTVPTTDSEQLLKLFAQANALRRDCKFDKAARVYKAIVDDAPEEAEAYWGLLLCKHGIAYADDPTTGKKVPLCHRPSFDSLLRDHYFDRVWESADSQAMEVYLKECNRLEEVRKGILADASRSKQYDIFLCCKEIDQDGNRTQDSVLAQNVYEMLDLMGYRVFYLPKALLGSPEEEKEPRIFAALNSAKIMLLFDTGHRSYQDVQVKYQWRSFQKLMASDSTRHLVLCVQNLDPDTLPKALTGLPIHDMGNPEGLRRRIEALFSANTHSPQVWIQTMLAQCGQALQKGDFAGLKTICQEILEKYPENIDACLFMLLAEYQVTEQSALYTLKNKPYFYENKFYQKLLPHASTDPRIQELSQQAERLILEKQQNDRYQQGLQALEEKAYEKALSIFQEVPDVLDAQKNIALCNKVLSAQGQYKTYKDQVGDGKKYLTKRFQQEHPQEYNHFVQIYHLYLDYVGKYFTAFMLLAWLTIPLCCLLSMGLLLGFGSSMAMFGEFFGVVAVISLLIAAFKTPVFRKLYYESLAKIGVAALVLLLETSIVAILPKFFFPILTIVAYGILIYLLRKLYVSSSRKKDLDAQLKEIKNTTFRAYGEKVRQELSDQYDPFFGKKYQVKLEDVDPSRWG